MRVDLGLVGLDRRLVLQRIVGLRVQALLLVDASLQLRRREDRGLRRGGAGGARAGAFLSAACAAGIGAKPASRSEGKGGTGTDRCNHETRGADKQSRS